MSTLAELDTHAGPALGTWTQFTDPQFIDLLGAAGYAFSIIDGEHGAFGIQTAAALIRACDAARVLPLVRVPRGDAGWITKALDAGAAGIVSPGCESADEARVLVAATRFAPEGTRGACPIVRAAGHSLTAWEQTEQAQRAVGAIALIETPAGVTQCGAIASVPGLTGVMAGPFDLSVAMGLPGQVEHPQVQAALSRVVEAADAAQVPAWMPVFAAERDALRAQIAHWSARGVRRFVIGADKIVAGRALADYRRWATAAT
jgi:4-hydroxy-2-oxoheptanedioate aldolase